MEFVDYLFILTVYLFILEAYDRKKLFDNNLRPNILIQIAIVCFISNKNRNRKIRKINSTYVINIPFNLLSILSLMKQNVNNNQGIENNQK